MYVIQTVEISPRTWKTAESKPEQTVENSPSRNKRGMKVGSAAGQLGRQ